MELRFSQIESDRFGIRIGRADSLTDPNELAELREFITRHKLQCVIARCSSKAVSLIHALEAEGFQLMEGRIRYIYSDLITASDFTTKLPDNAVVRMFSANDNLEPIVRSSYAGYKGHYHHNPLFKNTDCDDTYVDWALRSAADTSANNYCSVIEKSGALLGFATGAVAADQTFIGGLLGVDPQQRKQGYAAALHHHRLQWCKDKGINSVIVPTSLNNWTYQNLLAKIGYTILDSDFTFHWVSEK